MKEAVRLCAVLLGALSVGSLLAQGPAPEHDPPSDRQTGSLGVMYARKPGEVWSELLGLMRALKLNSEKSDPRAGILITRSQRFVDSRADLPTRPPEWKGFHPESFQLYVFVPPWSAPARVYVGSIVVGLNGTQSAHIYNGGDVERWLLGILGQHMQERGHWIPDDDTARTELARQLRPNDGDGRCDQIVSPDVITGGAARAVSPPKLIESSKMTPLYPYEKRLTGSEARLQFSAVIREDGTVSRVRLDDGQPRDEFTVAGGNVLSFWRYEPATLDGCPVSVVFKVIVQFRMR
jgi:TonB-like protein